MAGAIQAGTGWSSALLFRGILKKLTTLATDKSPFGGKGAPRKAKDLNWVKPKLVAEIEFAGWTDAGLV